MSQAPLLTRFFELEGPHAGDRLRRLGAALEDGGARVSLLASRDRPDLFLLVAESRGAPVAEPPDGCRVWTFERVAG